MYAWRKMTGDQRENALQERQLRRMPFHGPPHYGSDLPCLYHLTAACYEHRAILGASPARMAAFEAELVEALGGIGAGVTRASEPPEGGTTNGRNSQLLYWCVLPNHWHALVRTDALRAVIKRVGRLHGRSSHLWNGEDDMRGRTCWHRCADRRMRNEAHVHATVNYILNNPVHHGYVERWQDWPYSNARDYLEHVGTAEAARRWQLYPVLGYGKGWDDAEM